MSEKISRSIPTYDELKLRHKESNDRLLGHSVDQLQSTGQRLDFMDSAEDKATQEYSSHLVIQARALLEGDSPLNADEKS